MPTRLREAFVCSILAAVNILDIATSRTLITTTAALIRLLRSTK